MAKAVVKQPTMNPGIHVVMTYFIMLVVNVLVIFLAHNFFPQQVVLGNMSLSLIWATFLSAGLLSMIVTFCFPFVNQAETQIGRNWSPAEMMGIYLVINLISVWLITRASHIFGLGVTSWVIVFALAAVANLLQGVSMVMFEKMRTGK